MINTLYSINYFIFSVFFTLFMVEIGLALISLFSYDRYKSKIKKVIDPVWEITGTFAIFYLVNFEVSYPTLLVTIGTAYVIPLLLVAILIILRNIFIVFSEQIGNDKTEQRFRLIYSISTIAAAIIAIGIFTTGVSGIGISQVTNSLTSSFLLNPFTLIMLVALLLISLSLVNSIIRPSALSKLGPLLSLIGFGIGLFAAYNYLPNFHASLQSHIALVAFSILILAIASIMQLKKFRYSTIFTVLSVLVLINLFGISTYPYILGNSNVASYMANSAIANAATTITLIGGALVTASMLLFFYLSYSKEDQAQSKFMENLK